MHRVGLALWATIGGMLGVAVAVFSLNPAPALQANLNLAAFHPAIFAMPFIARVALRRGWALGLLAVLLVALTAAGVVLWYNLGGMRRDSETVLMAYANQYAGSIAFVVVDYWLQLEDRPVYRGRSEGTAFLADRQGYLLTNRHVACPWLEDNTLYMVINHLRKNDRSPRFDYRM